MHHAMVTREQVKSGKCLLLFSSEIFSHHLSKSMKTNIVQNYNLSVLLYIKRQLASHPESVQEQDAKVNV
jgi:hypothetical protein